MADSSGFQRLFSGIIPCYPSPATAYRNWRRSAVWVLKACVYLLAVLHGLYAIYQLVFIHGLDAFSEVNRGPNGFPRVFPVYWGSVVVHGALAGGLALVWKVVEDLFDARDRTWWKTRVVGFGTVITLVWSLDALALAHGKAPGWCVLVAVVAGLAQAGLTWFAAYSGDKEVELDPGRILGGVLRDLPDLKWYDKEKVENEFYPRYEAACAAKGVGCETKERFAAEYKGYREEQMKPGLERFIKEYYGNPEEGYPPFEDYVGWCDDQGIWSVPETEYEARREGDRTYQGRKAETARRGVEDFVENWCREKQARCPEYEVYVEWCGAEGRLMVPKEQYEAQGQAYEAGEARRSAEAFLAANPELEVACREAGQRFVEGEELWFPKPRASGQMPAGTYSPTGMISNRRVVTAHDLMEHERHRQPISVKKLTEIVVAQVSEAWYGRYCEFAVAGGYVCRMSKVGLGHMIYMRAHPTRRTYAYCSGCQGERGVRARCAKCDGSGWESLGYSKELGREFIPNLADYTVKEIRVTTTKQQCTECGGDGWVWQACGTCGGMGFRTGKWNEVERKPESWAMTYEPVR